MNKFLIVKTAVDRADPYGLLQIGAPADEYDIESEKISERISDSDSVEMIAKIMSDVFFGCFNADFPPEIFIEAAGEIRCEVYRII